MLKEAEDFAEEDKLAKERIDAKNSLESYIYSVKNQMDDEVVFILSILRKNLRTNSQTIRRTDSKML